MSFFSIHVEVVFLYIFFYVNNNQLYNKSHFILFYKLPVKKLKIMKQY